jgi:hypothetical protein
MKKALQNTPQKMPIILIKKKGETKSCLNFVYTKYLEQLHSCSVRNPYYLLGNFHTNYNNIFRNVVEFIYFK